MLNGQLLCVYTNIWDIIALIKVSYIITRDLDGFELLKFQPSLLRSFSRSWNAIMASHMTKWISEAKFFK